MFAADAVYDMCMRYSERTQVLLSPAQREKVARVAARTGRSAGAVIRDAIDAYEPAGSVDREAAMDQLFDLDAPVDDWSAMEREIEAGYQRGLPRAP
jgi:predicted transcriptional regulator